MMNRQPIYVDDKSRSPLIVYLSNSLRGWFNLNTGRVGTGNKTTSLERLRDEVETTFKERGKKIIN